MKISPLTIPGRSISVTGENSYRFCSDLELLVLLLLLSCTETTFSIVNSHDTSRSRYLPLPGAAFAAYPCQGKERQWLFVGQETPRWGMLNP